MALSKAEKVLRVAGLSVGLGLAMEMLLLIAAGSLGAMPAGKAIVADLVQKISWATIVCVGVAIGGAASRSFKTVSFAGFLSAPLAFNIARALHKSAAQALGIALPAAMGPSPLTLAGIKAVQYALLGYGLSTLAKKESAGAVSYALVGALSGIVFGGLIVYLFHSAGPLPAAQLVSRSINEVLFPIGCAMVLYAAKALA
jgi:hypothetical protein